MTTSSRHSSQVREVWGILASLTRNSKGLPWISLTSIRTWSTQTKIRQGIPRRKRRRIACSTITCLGRKANTSNSKILSRISLRKPIRWSMIRSRNYISKWRITSWEECQWTICGLRQRSSMWSLSISLKRTPKQRRWAHCRTQWTVWKMTFTWAMLGKLQVPTSQ